MKLGKKTGYHHGDLRRALMDASVEVIRKQGVEALNLRALATRLDVSSGAPYHHFANREELLVAIAQEGFELLRAHMTCPQVSAAATAGARLQALGMAYVRFAHEHPGHFRVMFREDVHRDHPAALSDASRETFEVLASAVDACQADGAAPPTDPGLLTLAAWALVHGLATLWVDGALPTRQGHFDPARMAPQVTELLVSMFRSLAAAPNPAPPTRPRTRRR
jgi:AcrR family transcriptional regulator